MKTRSEITSILILAAACGDSSMMTASSTSVTMTSGSPTSAAEEGTDSSTGTTASTDPSSSSDPTANNTSGATTTPGNTGPEFISFSTNVAKVTEGQSVVFTAVLMDADGVGDIAGGSLLSEDQSFDFGPFIAAGQQGTYSISLSWDQMHQAEAINFDNSEPSRQFIAQFVDNGGNRVTANKSIALTCAGGSACEAVCKDLNSDAENCGTCGRACAMGCEAGNCAPTWGECITSDDGFDTCAMACQSMGGSCVSSGCSNNTHLYYGNILSCMNEQGGSFSSDDCESILTWGSPAIRCCCTDPS